MDTFLVTCAGLTIWTLAATAFEKTAEEWGVAQSQRRVSNEIAAFCAAAAGIVCLITGFYVLSLALTALQIFLIVATLMLVGAATFAWRRSRECVKAWLSNLPGLRRIEQSHQVESVLGLAGVVILFMFATSLFVHY